MIIWNGKEKMSILQEGTDTCTGKCEEQYRQMIAKADESMQESE